MASASSTNKNDSEFWLEAQRQLCKSNLKYLCTEILGYTDWDVCHDDLVEWDIAHTDKKFRMYLLPRKHLKSSIKTIAGTIQDLLQDPNHRILIANAVWDNARKFLAELKEHLQRPELVRLFGEFHAEHWNQDEIIIAQRNQPNKTPSILTAGIEKAITGQHFTRIKVDDWVDPTNVTTKEQIQKTINQFKNLFKMLDPNGTMEVIGTRWHDADLYGWILKELTNDAMAEKFYVYTRYARESERGVPAEDGHPIFPKKFTVDNLTDLKKQIGTYEWATNYMNNPINPETQLFKPPVRHWESIPEGSRHFITVDLAGTEEDSDFNVITDCAWSKANQLYVVEYRRGRFTPHEVIDHIFEMVDAHHPVIVGVESIAYQRIMLYLLDMEMRKRKKFFPIMPLTPHKDKFERLRALQPLWSGGNILLKPGMVELEEEFFRFPVSANDDIHDTVAMVLQLLTATMPVEKKENPWDKLAETSPASAKEWENVHKTVFNRNRGKNPAKVLTRIGA